MIRAPSSSPIVWVDQEVESKSTQAKDDDLTKEVTVVKRWQVHTRMITNTKSNDLVAEG